MTTPTQIAVAVVLGACLAAGLLLVGTRVPRWAAPNLTHRISPYLRDIGDPLGLTPTIALVGLGAGWRTRRDGLLAGLGGEQLSRRLRRAGWKTDAVGFRSRQLAGAVIGLLAGSALVLVLAVTGRAAPILGILPPLAAALAVVLRDVQLTTAVKRRTARIEDELPTVLEFLALCLSAGEGLRDALRRVGDVGSGELTAELRAAVLASGTGSNLGDALTDCAQALGVPALSRAVDQLVAAIDRGAPLAAVLHDQASDARDEAKRSLIERAGRNEIAMLIPLVFLVMPLSVLFAIFPGIVMLRLGVG